MAIAPASHKVNDIGARRIAPSSIESGHDEVASHAREQQVSSVYLAHIVYLKHVVQREAELQRAEMIARTNEGLGSLPIESGRARLVARLKAMRQSNMTQRNHVEQVPIAPFDLDLA
jgi:hypothetical protein